MVTMTITISNNTYRIPHKLSLTKRCGDCHDNTYTTGIHSVVFVCEISCLYVSQSCNITAVWCWGSHDPHDVLLQVAHVSS